MVKQGKIIVLDGLDGCGKSTQFAALGKLLTEQGETVKPISFPMYDKPSAALVKMYLRGDFSDTPDGVNAYAASSFYAEKNLHQRGFTGTVFAAQRVNFSSVDAQAHMLIGDKTVWIDLGDVFHAQDIPILLRAAAWGHAFSCGHCITLFLFYKETISGMRSSDRIPQEAFTQRLFTERPFLRSSQNRQDPYS